MARLRSVGDEFDDTEATPPPPAEKPRKRRQPRGTRAATAAPEEPQTAPEAEEEPPAKPARQAPQVLAPATVGEAFRVSLYLHPDDGRTLELAKVDDRADHQARIRAMIALWRSNDRFRAAVDKLARTAPAPRGRK